MTHQVLLTSVCRPLGVRHGDSPSVGYELLHEQVTRAQGLFSPRSHHTQFSLEYIAENLEAPTAVLQYPSRRELVRELRRGYEVVGVSFVLATYHRMKEVVALVRKHSLQSKIVLGGYGTVAPDEMLRPYGDHICREEGVGFMRRLLGEPEIRMPYRHPLIINRLRVFGKEISRTGIVFGGLGCPNGCDFCCTSHFFKRKHIRLLPTGADLYQVVERYLEVDPRLSILILDEDFLLNRRRAMEFRECVLRGGKPLSIFVFASVRAVSQYTVTEILEMGIDGMWIGYEGTRSGYAKQSGRPVEEIFREFREHGITILASMIVGFPYQTPEIIEEELSGLLALRPVLTQFLIYGPCPGTPFYEQVVREGKLLPEVAEDPELFYRRGTGFYAMASHPSMTPDQIEVAQKRCFGEDFRRLGPVLYRSVERWLEGYLKLRESPSAFLRAKAERIAADLRKAYPVFLAGRLFGPTAQVRRWIGRLQEQLHIALGSPTWKERLQSVGAVGLASWTGLTLRLGLFQHPPLVRHTFRMSDAPCGRAWERLRGKNPAGLLIRVERRPASTVWVLLEGRLTATAAGRFVADLRAALVARRKDRVVLDLARLAGLEDGAVGALVAGLGGHRDRIRIILPRMGEFAALAAIFRLYQ
ncbi:MAG TPA: radical SAM protein [Isosphaeraceae bacterium]|nr:radical SAM protein [Isosphaeraceae bacterium]